MNFLRDISCEQIMDSLADGVFTVDLEWRITFFNRAASAITGVPRGEAMGRKCWEVFRSSICDGYCALKAALEAGESRGNRSLFFVRADGTKVPISISAAPLRDRRGRTVGGVETFRDLSALRMMQKKLDSLYCLDDILTRSPSFRRTLGILPQIAASGSTVLITGESGTGKELVARAIHNLSPRAGKPFVAVNCGALPENLLESELFGHKAGAFTDARRDKPGRFQLADKGTLFLDEIGDMPLALQVKILRALQDKVVDPLGAVAGVPVNVRIIAATNRDLEEMVGRQAFRSDLYYRLNVVRLVLPPLRQRAEDVPLLAGHFIERQNALTGKDVRGLAPEVLQLLMRHPFPGNVRELENIIEYAFILCPGGRIEQEHLPEGLAARGDQLQQASLCGTLQAIKCRAAAEALVRNGGRVMATCRELGISKDTLRRLLNREP
ncbi:MAG: sigma 54-interacting transcriptional regulator [Desulfomicrobium sp.]|nr:sigma 54-interacting transcriptional regulator [Pseudomonadota bacterium]MBV1710388.1 sigma 54-interacting transcriptional regulator [Desulfomicrobium sp.]MBU4570009.1 sigma 54-interacting transcriptional regulator [Pseudomonadota bacterium]MBU4593927.1 sigma 54-interacting transcriptional regulator [Pseudomonadota bacterium]MBV1721060.1 sigma 54-interacting transcriptional regulator [Desulfomicrobium sp.]